MLTEIIAFLVMLNPFALFLYLKPIMDELDQKDFIHVFLKASLISFGIFFFFFFTGSFIFEKFFQISFESFRIFGGIVIFSFAYLFIVKGHLALIHMKEDLDDLASEIALPFMVGAGTISLSILMRDTLTLEQGVVGLTLIFLITFFFIIFLKFVRDHLDKKRKRIAFDKVMQIFLRLNGFFIGAIGIDMMLTGILNVFF